MTATVDLATPGVSGRELALHVHLPTGLLGVASGAVAPVIPLAALAHGGSAATAGLVVALSGLCMLLTDLPAGWLVGRLGERSALALGSVIGLAGAVLCALDLSLGTLALGVGLVGSAQAVWGLARQAYLTEVVPVRQRARVISAMAGSNRLGFFLGPFAAALILGVGPDRVGHVFVVQLVAVVLAAVLMCTLREPRRTGARPAPVPIVTVAVRERTSLGRLGPAAFAVGALRAARLVVLPLWAVQVGMSAGEISLMFGISGVLDVALSYPAGVGLDRFGRRAMAIPSTLLFTVAILGVPLATGPAQVWVVAIVAAAANGLTNGLVMTIGADAAPADARPQFLALWRLLHDAGMSAAPAGVGLIAGALGMAVAPVPVGVVGLIGTVLFARYLPRTTPGAGGIRRATGTRPENPTPTPSRARVTRSAPGGRSSRPSAVPSPHRGAPRSE